MKQQALSATLWSGLEIFLRHGLQFVVVIVLARLLTPDEFGTIALLYIFVGVAGVLADGGFSAALIQRQDVTHVDESTVFWFNLGMGATLALLLWLSAPSIAAFYQQPVLVPLVGVMALNVFITSLGAIHRALLTKQLDFRTQMKVGVLATTLSGGVAIALALQGAGVWALAAQMLCAATITTLALWGLHRWRPALVFSMDSARRLFGFGGYLLAAGLLDVAYTRLYTLLIGRFYSVRELGFYTRADTTQQLPVEAMTNILSRVAFPVFSAAAHDPARLQRGMRLALRGMMFINVPMMLGLAVVAEPFVLTLFGPEWRPAVPILQVLCLAGLFWPLHVINLNVLMAQGYSNLFFRLEVLKKVVGVGLTLVGALYGVMGIAWSQVVFNVLAFGINAHYTRRHLNYGVAQQVLDIYPTLLVGIAMAATVSAVSPHIELGYPIELLTLVILGAAVFSVVALSFNIGPCRDALDMLRQWRKRPKQAG